MIRVSVWYHGLDERYLRLVTQLGAEAVDFGAGNAFPGVREQGYPDLDGVLAIKRALQAWGLEINRVTLADIPADFMAGETDDNVCIENACRAIAVFGEAGVPIARLRVGGDAMPHRTRMHMAVHRGGYRARAEYRHWAQPELRSPEEVEAWWGRFCRVFERLVPAAEDAGVRLAIHPSDTPYAATAFDSFGFHRVIDAFPSRTPWDSSTALVPAPRPADRRSCSTRSTPSGVRDAFSRCTSAMCVAAWRRRAASRRCCSMTAT